MTITITDPQHGYPRPATQGDWDNAMTLIASLKQQITDITNAQAQAKALAEQPVAVEAQAAPAAEAASASSSSSSSRTVPR